MLFFPHGLPAVSYVLFGATVVLAAMFFRRVVYHLKRAGLERRHLSFNPLATARVQW